MKYEKYAKAERTRQFIIESVSPIFNKKGYTATSLSDLIQATGLSKGSIYGNFKNKDEVAVAAFRHNVRFISKILAKKIEESESSRGKLLAFPETYRLISESLLKRGGCPVLNTSVDSSDVHSRLQQEVRRVIQSWKRHLVTILNVGLKRGEFSGNVDQESVAEILICLVEGGHAMTKATGEYSFLENSLTQMETVIRSL
ncbi:MAG: TetR/AcrR family transcriptional regulator [Desulfobulbaceae bacterium]|nr:TetR/AcrR family transcriptional regulator [Desulfobulbaceae bacterium]